MLPYTGQYHLTVLTVQFDFKGENSVETLTKHYHQILKWFCDLNCIAPFSENSSLSSFSDHFHGYINIFIVLRIGK